MNDEALVRALARIQAANLDRPTPWGERAAVALRLACQARSPISAALEAHDPAAAPSPAMGEVDTSRQGTARVPMSAEHP